jgi:hypothetical protein
MLRITRYDQNYILVFVHSTCYSGSISITVKSSQQTCGKISNTKFNENPSSGRRVVPCGQTAVQTDMTKLTAALR